MTNERKIMLLNNMYEYLINCDCVDFKKIGADEEAELSESYNNCLGYIVEIVGNDGDEFFFENVLGFTKEELICEGMEWVYE